MSAGPFDVVGNYQGQPAPSAPSPSSPAPQAPPPAGPAPAQPQQQPIQIPGQQPPPGTPQLADYPHLMQDRDDFGPTAQPSQQPQDGPLARALRDKGWDIPPGTPEDRLLEVVDQAIQDQERLRELGGWDEVEGYTNIGRQVAPQLNDFQRWQQSQGQQQLPPGSQFQQPPQQPGLPGPGPRQELLPPLPGHQQQQLGQQASPFPPAPPFDPMWPQLCKQDASGYWHPARPEYANIAQKLNDHTSWRRQIENELYSNPAQFFGRFAEPMVSRAVMPLQQLIERQNQQIEQMRYDSFRRSEEGKAFDQIISAIPNNWGFTLEQKVAFAQGKLLEQQQQGGQPGARKRIAGIAAPTAADLQDDTLKQEREERFYRERRQASDRQYPAERRGGTDQLPPETTPLREPNWGAIYDDVQRRGIA